MQFNTNACALRCAAASALRLLVAHNERLGVSEVEQVKPGKVNAAAPVGQIAEHVHEAPPDHDLIRVVLATASVAAVAAAALSECPHRVLLVHHVGQHAVNTCHEHHNPCLGGT